MALWRSFILLSFTAITATVSVAQQPSNVIAQGKGATAWLLVGDGSATAFCFHEAGYFATNYHVLRQLRIGDAVKLVMRPGEPDEKFFTATLERFDAASDLAVVRVVEPSQHIALELGLTESLRQQPRVAALGYPFRKKPSAGQAIYPSLSVNLGDVTVAETAGNNPGQIHFGMPLDPGNSGGPLLNRTGQVVGIIRSGIAGAGLNSVVRVEKLKDLLWTPAVAFVPPQISRSEANRAVQFKARLDRLLKDQYLPATMHLEIQAPGEPFRRFEMSGSQDNFEVSVVPIPQASVLPKASMGAVTVSVAAAYREKERARRTFTIHLDGEVVESFASAITAASPAGSESAPSKSSEASAPSQPNQSAPSTITVVPVAPGARSEIAAPNLASETTVHELHGTINDLAVGGGGQFLVLHLGSQHKLAIFDVLRGDIVNSIPLTEDNIRFAAGNSKLIVVLRDSRVIQRWNLANAQRELATLLTVGGEEVYSITMGSASSGPLLIHSLAGADPKGRPHFAFMDINSLKTFPVPVQGRGMLSPSHLLQVRASANGQTFGMVDWSTGAQVLALSGKTGRVSYEHREMGHMAPSADGKLLCTGAGIYNQELRRLDKPDGGLDLTIPAHGGGYILRASALPTPSSLYNLRSLSVHREDELDTPIVTIPNTDILPTQREPGYMPVDKRVHFLTAANRLVTIPSTNDRLVLQRLDLDQALDKLGIDYFFFTSSPATSVKAGTRFEYPMIVKSKKGGLTYQIESGPMEMIVSPSGVITWEVPLRPKSLTTSVIVSVKDAAGKERFQSFALEIERAAGK